MIPPLSFFSFLITSVFFSDAKLLIGLSSSESSSLFTGVVVVRVLVTVTLLDAVGVFVFVVVTVVVLDSVPFGVVVVVVLVSEVFSILSPAGLTAPAGLGVVAAGLGVVANGLAVEAAGLGVVAAGLGVVAAGLAAATFGVVAAGLAVVDGVPPGFAVVAAGLAGAGDAPGFAAPAAGLATAGLGVVAAGFAGVVPAGLAAAAAGLGVVAAGLAVVDGVVGVGFGGAVLPTSCPNGMSSSSSLSVIGGNACAGVTVASFAVPLDFTSVGPVLASVGCSIAGVTG